MNYSKIQKSIASIIMPFFFFTMVFNFNINFFNFSNAGNTKLYSLVSILVNENIYNEVSSNLKTYAEDISKQLENTKVVIIPTPANATPFQIASLNEGLYFEGYKNLNKNADFQSKLVGTILVGNFPIPTVYKGKEYSTTILPYVDFEDKSYIYNHKTKKYEKNRSNIEGIRPEIWHGVISPNTGNKEENIKEIKDFFNKDHNYYEGTGNFEKEKGIINGKLNEENPSDYQPYVFYFDQFREQKSVKYPSYIGYQAYLDNKEAINYNRYSKELAEKIQKDVLEFPKKEINNLISQIYGTPAINNNQKGLDLSKSSDIMSKAVIDKTTKNFLEVINSSKIGDFRKDVNNAGRYSQNGNSVNVDMIPYIISVLDKIGDQSIKSADKIIENKIDNLVMSGGLSRYIALPTLIEEIPDNANVGRGSLSCEREYTNILYGKVAENIKKADECSIYRGSNENGGKLVKANRGIDLGKIEEDSNLCNNGKTSGYWGGNSPLNLNKNILSTKGDFVLNNNNYFGSIRPIFDIAGSKYVSDNSKVDSPLDCYNNNYIKSKVKENPYNPGNCQEFILPINGIQKSNSYTCGSSVENFIFKKSFSENYKDHLSEKCAKREMYLDFDNDNSPVYDFVTKGKVYGKNINPNTKTSDFEKNCKGADRYFKYKYYYKRIPSYIKHISPTPKELKIETKAKVSPNLPIDVDRYIDFIGASGKKDKIKYTNLFRLKEKLSDKDSFDTQLEKIGKKLDLLLDKKSAEINNVIKNNDPSFLGYPDNEIYKNYLKIADYPNEKIDLKKYLKNYETKKIDIFGEEKELNYYDDIKFSLFWNNLKTVGQKYKFVFENYLSDQTSSKYKHFLPKNKKIYEIAYLGAPGNTQNMYIGIDPKEKGENPYSDIDKKNSLLDNKIFSFSVQSSQSGFGTWESNIGTTDFQQTQNNEEKSLFKCAPPEGVSIFKWPQAVMCRIKNLFPVKINFNSSRCSSETLFSDKNKELDDNISKITDNISDNGNNDSGNNDNGNNDSGNNNICRNDLNENGVEDCTEKNLKDAKIELISSAKKAHINSFIGLEARFLDKQGIVYKDLNNVKTKFELIRIVDKKTNKVVKKENYKNYIDFNESVIPSRKGHTKYSINSKNKEADYYIRAIGFLKDKDNKEILKINSNIIKIKIRNELFSSLLNKITNSSNGIFDKGDNEILASDKKNIYLIDLNNGKLNTKIKNIEKDSNSKEKIIISLNHYSSGNKQIPLDYPLKLSLTKNGKKVIEDMNITKQNLSNFYSPYSLSESGNYKLKITNKYGETTTKIFTILPEKANNVNLFLSTNILERNGDITSNIFVIKDKFGNISDGYNYKVILKSEGNFNFPLNNGENLNSKEINVFNGYKGFRLKPGNKNGTGKIKINILYNNKIIATKSQILQTIEKIKVNVKKPEIIKVGGNKYKFDLNFVDNQGNLLKNLNSRVYLSIAKRYGITKKPYFPIINGKATIDFKTKNIAGENIPIELKMEGLRKIIKDSISIEPEKPIKLDINLSKDIAKASINEKITAKVNLRDRYNNTVFNDNSTKVKIEILNKYKNILKLNGPVFQTVKKGEAKFELNATSEPGTAYLKFSTIPDLSNNTFKINGENVAGVGEKSVKVRTYYFWDKYSFKNKKYNSLYTVMLGADYGNIREKDYLASSILFDKNNRSLAITSLLNNPYKKTDLISIYSNGKIKDVSSQNNITQDLKLTTSINKNNKLNINIFNKILNREIGNINYNFGANTKLGICKTTIGECGINKNINSINIKPESKEYQIKKENGKILIEKNGIKILEIDNEGNFISNTLLNFNIDNASKENYLVINLSENNSTIAKLILNISNTDLEYKLTNTSYSIRNITVDGNLVKNIYSNNFLESDDSVNNFSEKREDDIENFRKKGSIGWGGENRFLLDFASGKNVGESVKNKQSFGTINLGDPVISLKPIRAKFKNGDFKSFNATIGKKISNDNNIKNYQIFDYDNDNKDDLLLIKNNGYLKLLENKTNANNFLDKGNLAYIADHGNPDFVKTGDFTGDGFDDIFFVNNKGIPYLLNNENKDFKRINIENQIKLNGKIVQVEKFDMDNDGKTDIVTLDDSGEINIFYGGGTANKPKFTKKLVGNGFGLKLSSEPRNNGALINYDGLYQIPSKPNTSTGVVNENFLNGQIFVKQIIGANATPGDNLGKNIYKTFIKSEYSKSAGIEVKKVFKDVNGGNLQSGDIVEVEVTIKNVSSSIKRNISYLDNIQKPFIKPDENFNYKKLGFSEPIAGYDFYLKDFNLAPGAEKKITYKLKTPTLQYGYIKVGLFEKGEIGDDPYGDIIIKKDNKNCSDNSQIYKSIDKRKYADLQKNNINCNLEKLKLPKEIEDAKKINIDNNNNGIPDYIDELKNDPEKAKEYSKEKLKEYNKSQDDLIEKSESNFLDKLDNINNWTEKKLENLDNLIKGFSCGFASSSCISTPLNRAPLAAGNDPTLFGSPVGDGLKVEEGIPIYSSLTIGRPHTRPPEAGGAGGYFGTNYALNTYRLFTSPTLTGGAGVAACFGGPASVAGRSNPPGLSPVVPGGNCIVTAKSLLSCSEDGSEGDPSSIGTPDNFGGGNGGGNGSGKGNGFGVINGNCQFKNKSYSQVLNKNFVDKYYNNLSSGLGFPTSFTTEYKNELKGFNNNIASGINNKPLFSLNGKGVGEDEIKTGGGFAGSGDGDFKDIIKIVKKRVSAFPSFLMDWTTRQIDEIVIKLTDLPTLFIIYPDFSGVIDTDWIDFGKKAKKAYSDAVKKEEDNNKIIEDKIKGLESQKNNLKCNGEDRLKCLSIESKIKILEAQKLGTSGKSQSSGIKAAYEFLSNVPIINLEPQQINVNLPFPDTNTLDKFIVDGKSSLIQWKNEVNLGKINGNTKSKINKLISNLQQNIEIAEEYKQFPRKLTKLLNQKEVRINQVMCSVNSISEITGGWIGRNGKRFKAWVETYILIKAVLKSWQLLVDVFQDYDAECHECKNERQDLLNFQFKLVDMIIPKIPIFQFPKWPDLILDLHNIRLSINVKIPDVVITNRPIVLPNIPKLTLPEANANVELNIPDMDLLPRFEFHELPDIPTLPEIKLPDLPPPPKLPKIFSQLEGVLKILKLVTKAMCLLKQLPFVPEWRAGDQIAFLTERNGYMPTDFINLTPPQFSVPYLDAIKVTTYVNLEQDTTFLVDTLKSIIEPLNSSTNNWANKFSNAGLDNLDFSSKSININKKINLDNKTSFSQDTAKGITKLFSYIKENKDKKVGAKEFLNSINNNLATDIFINSTRTDKIKKLWKDVDNYNFNKENKLISELKENNRKKFENLNNILEKELKKNYKLKKNLKNYLNKDNKLFIKISSKTKNKDFVEYKKSLKKYNDKFIKSVKNLISQKRDYQVNEIKNEGKNLLTRIDGGLNSFRKNTLKNNLLASATQTRTLANSTSQNSCTQANHSQYKYNYKGLYILEKNKSYRLFNYIDNLNGNEEYNPIDFDNDGDLDLLYMVNGEIYLKENLNIQKPKNTIKQSPITVQINDNKYFNGNDFIEAVNGFKEINSDNLYINLVFKSPTDKSINHFVVEYYTIVDKFLNENKIDGIKKHIIDSFVEKENPDYTNNLIKKDFAYINYIGDIPAVRLDTYEMKNIGESLLKNNQINLSATTPIYTANNSAKIKYYIGKDKKHIFEKSIPKNSSIRFKEKITIIAINGKIYSKGNKKISLVGRQIKDYIGLPLFENSEFSIIPDLENKLNKDLANVEIKYSSGYSKKLNFTEITSYYYYNLGIKSENYLIRTPEINDFYYGKIYAIKNNIKGIYSSQKLFSPQLAADKNAPELDGLSKIRIPVYQEKKIDLRKYIYENSGINGIKNIQLKLATNSKILPDNYKINKTINNLSIDFQKFNKLFKEKIEIILEDNNGNKSSIPVDFEVYSPKPEILGNKGNKINGKIDEKLLEEPINIYRIRSGRIKRLETKNGKIKTYTVDEGLFNFDAKGDNKNGLYIKYNNEIIAEINETTGKINIKNNNYKISVLNNSYLFPEIIIKDNSGNKVYSQFIKLNKNIDIFQKENFNKIDKNGLYIKINNPEYDLYNIPNGAKYSAGANVIYKKSDTSKKPIFTIFPDGRIKYFNRYIINYEDNGNDIILELNSRIGNKKIAEILFKINATYLIK